MRRLELLAMAVISVFAVTVMTAAAASTESSPLPDTHTALPGESYSLLLGGHLAGVSKLEDAGQWIDRGKRTLDLIDRKRLNLVSPAFLKFLGVEEVIEKHKCKSVGANEANGKAPVFHLVYTALSPTEKLEIVALRLFEPVIVNCNASAIEIENMGPFMSGLNTTPKAGKEGDSTTLQTSSHCSANGVQELPYYYDDTLTRVPTTLLAKITGLRPVQACDERYRRVIKAQEQYY